MIQIRRFGLIAAAALTLIALAGVSSASANVFKSDSESTDWNGSRKGGDHWLKLGADVFSCNSVAFSGTTTGKSTNQITVTPELGSCKWLQNEVGFAMNGCKLRFRPGITEQLVGWVDIVGCKAPMTFEAKSGGFCRLEIDNQNGIGTIEYKNAGTGSTRTITMVANLQKLTYTRQNGGLCSGSSGTFQDSSYTGEWTVKGSSGGTQVGVEAAYAPATLFATEEAPATLSGVRAGSSIKTLNFYWENVQCSGATYTGSLATTSSAALTVTPSYTGCKFVINGEQTAIPDGSFSMGGCSYVLHASGGFDIAGATCASSPISISGPGCTITVGPQNLSGLVYTSEGAGSLRSLGMSSGVTGLKYTATGASCVEQGTFSNGAFQSKATFTATDSEGQTQGLWLE